MLLKYVVSGGGTGLHWDDLDEAIDVPALFLGVGGGPSPLTLGNR